MIPARRATAKTILVGPILDSSGAAVTGEVIGNLRLSKNGGTPAALNASATLVHQFSGVYLLALTASDADTVGSSQIGLDDGTNTMAPVSLTVMEQAVYDIFYASGATGIVSATLADTAHGGTSAVLTLERMIVAATTTDEPALKLTGNGSGAGLAAAGGATGSGATFIAGGGNGITATGGSGGHGMSLLGDDIGDGLNCRGGIGGGDGVEFRRGSGSGDDIKLTSSDAPTLADAIWTNTNRTLTSLSGLTVDTVTNLTNLPAITANWLTAAGLASDAASEIATAWGSRVLGNGRTADMYLQGFMNKVEQSADGLTITIYASDDITPLQEVAATRLATTVGGVKNISQG